MKKSINAWAFDWTLDFETVFAMTKKAGFDCIELNLDAEGAHAFTPNSDDDTFELVRQLSKKYQVKVGSVSSSLYWSTGLFGSRDSEKRNAAVKLFKKTLNVPQQLVRVRSLSLPVLMLTQATLKALQTQFPPSALLKPKLKIQEFKLVLKTFGTDFSFPLSMQNTLLKKLTTLK